MNWLKSAYKWCYRIFWYTFVSVIITLAIAISLFRLYLPDVKDYRAEIESFASEVLDQDVRIESMDAKLSGITPLVIFNEVYLLDTHTKNEIVHFQQARLTIDLFRSIFRMEIVPDSFTVIGVDLGIKRKSDGSFSIQGLDIDKLGKQIPLASSEEESDELATWFFRRSKLAIKNSRIVYQDTKISSKAIQFDNVNFFLRNDENHHQLNGNVTLPDELGRNLEIAVDFNGNILNPSEWYGEVFYRAEELNLANWGVKPKFLETSLEQGRLDLSLWGNWQAGNITSFTADVTAKELVINFGNKSKPFQMNKLAGLIDWHTDDRGWKMNVSSFQYHGKKGIWPESSIALRYAKNNEQLTAYSSFLRLEDIRHFLTEAKFFDKEHESTMAELKPVGDLRNTYLEYSFNDSVDDLALKSDFVGLSLSPWKSFPGINNITGHIWLDQTAGRLELSSNDSKVAVPAMFREPIYMTSLNGKIDWYRSGKAWHVSSPDIAVVSPDISADLGFYAMIPEDGSSPYLDLQAAYKNGDAKQAWKYYPVSIMDEELVKWLDNAFLSGEVISGGALYNGRLSDFPYADNSGSLLADFRTRDVKLHYQPGWPDILVKDAEIEITETGLSARANKGRIFNSSLTGGRVTIRNFLSPLLVINSKVTGQSRDLLRYLVESPIYPEAKALLKEMRVLGKTSGEFTLRLPLSESVEARIPVDYEVKARLQGNEVISREGALVIRKINGDLDISPKGVFSDNVQFNWLGGPSRAKIYTTSLNKLQSIKMSVHGNMDTGSLYERTHLPILKHIGGNTEWQGILSLGNQKENGYFQFVSRLNGVESGLPPPLNKKADSEKLFSLIVQFPENDNLPVSIRYGSEMSMALAVNLDDQENIPLNKGDIIFSSGPAVNSVSTMEPVLPASRELVIRGHLAEFKFDEWLDLINEGVEGETIGLASLRIPVRLNMDYLKIITREGESEQAERRDPATIATFNTDIRNLYVNEIGLGHVSFKMFRHDDGLLLKELTLDAPDLKLQGEASWLLRNGRHSTNLLLIGETDNLGDLLTRFGFAATLKKGKTKAVIQANWYDTPDRFSLEKFNGSIGAVINDGVLLDVKPGAGRMLGLFSLAELPRRLLLDFSELDKGFGFKQIVGQIDIRNGDAFAETLKIISPIALITIEGRTGLATRDFDQHVIVVPGVSGTLPVISWLAWGGQVGALAFLLDQIIGDQFDSAIATEYEITGSWENPKITKLKKEPPAELSEEEEND